MGSSAHLGDFAIFFSFCIFDNFAWAAMNYKAVVVTDSPISFLAEIIKASRRITLIIALFSFNFFFFKAMNKR
jgi:hypothetical protein